ncbi:MAG: enoyl-CoA hydratase-related protein [Rhodospirillales bacterium]
MPDETEIAVLLELPKPHVALIRLNRPDKLNAMNLAMRQQLAEVFVSLSADNDIRVIVVTGNDKAFVAGADLAEFEPRDAIEQFLAETERYWEPLRTCSKPVIAAVQGFALGGGMELALHADIIVAGRGALFAQSEPNIGLMPGAGGSQRLVRALGKYRAMRFLLTAERVDAEEGYRLGFVSEVVDDDKTLDRALEMAGRIASLPPLATRQIKEVVLAGADAPLDTAMRLERKAFQILFSSNDKAEGMAAFREKRNPRFEGR